MSKTIKLEIVPKDQPSTALVSSADFQQARVYVEEIRDLGRRANHVSILLGAELNRLKTSHGASHGGDRKSSCQSANLIAWPELVKKETGLSYETCQRCMKLALGAKSQIKMLTAPDVVNTPFAQLPEARRKAVTAAIKKVVDGHSMSQLMLDFGVVKARKVNLPPGGGKSPKNDHKGGAANREEKDDTGSSLTIANKIELAQGHIQDLISMMGSEAWQCLEDADLATLDNTLDKWHKATGALIAKRKDQAARAKSKKGGES